MTAEQRRAALVSAQVWGTRASWAVAAQPLLVCLVGLGLGLLFRSFFGDFTEYLDEQSNLPPERRFDPANGEPFAPQRSGWFSLIILISPLSYAVLALRMVWLHQATAAARLLGRPTRREAGLACAGWIIPLVSLWWPLESIGDLFAPGTKPRKTLGWWWALHLLSGLGALVAFLGLASVAALVAGVLVVAAVSGAAAYLERALVRDVGRQFAAETPLA